MKIGVFDSGIGGLVILKSLADSLPRYEYAYLGDTARVPYGGHDHPTILSFLREAVAFLLARDCQLVIVACNTASAQALAIVQKEYATGPYAGRRILGVIIPTVETAILENGHGRLGILATAATVRSGIYPQEIRKLGRKAEVFQSESPLLVPLIESGQMEEAERLLGQYLRPLREKDVEAIILGCTHYPLLKEAARRMAPETDIISQDEIIAGAVARYLERHPETEQMLGKSGKRELFATAASPGLLRMAKEWLGSEIEIVDISMV